MRRWLVVSILSALVVVSCERPGDPARARVLAARVLKGTLAYPPSTLVGVSAGQDAAEASFTTGAAVQDVAAWYRRALELNGWSLKSDAADRDGTIIIYAEKETRPLWVRLKANVGGPGTTYTLIGAVVAGDTVR